MKAWTYTILPWLGFVTGFSLLTACASNVPEVIKTAPPNNPGLEQVREQPLEYMSQSIRWGGIILETENTQHETWLTLLALKLNSVGKPVISDNSVGRFIAIVPQFLEPAVYARDRMLTVRGKVLRVETRQIGEFSYQYPVIQVEHHYIWPKETEPSYYDNPPWWYDPWYGPYYPYYHPYWPHRY